MAALARHGVLKTGRLLTAKNVFVCSYATKAEKKKGIDRKVGPKIDSSAESLAAKGFLRSQKDYTPPEDVYSKLQGIFQSVLNTTDKSARLDDMNQKFAVLEACSNALQHSVPNSLLYTIETLTDIYSFYETPVDTTTPLDKLKTMDLPKNLHVQHEYFRFHPDTDRLFGGISAFPKSSTLITGLKYKGKYKGHQEPSPWPHTS